MDPRYIAALVLFTASIIGSSLPGVTRVPVLVIRPFACGIVFAVAFTHLLPDAATLLNVREISDAITDFLGTSMENEDDTIPVAQVLMLLGGFLMIVIEELIPHYHQQDYPSRPLSHKSPKRYGAVSTDEESSLLNQPNAKTSTATVAKVYAMEFAIATHSVIIGFGMGALKTSALTGLTIALFFHQVFEGIALGMAAVESGMQRTGMFFLVLVFSLSVPLGAVAGVLTADAAAARAASADSVGETSSLAVALLQGVPNAVSGGMLAHIGVELLNADFLEHSPTGWGKIRKLCLLSLGALSMSFLSIWA